MNANGEKTKQRQRWRKNYVLQFICLESNVATKKSRGTSQRNRQSLIKQRLKNTEMGLWPQRWEENQERTVTKRQVGTFSCVSDCQQR